jgi:hypothetical protein
MIGFAGGLNRLFARRPCALVVGGDLASKDHTNIGAGRFSRWFLVRRRAGRRRCRPSARGHEGENDATSHLRQDNS